MNIYDEDKEDGRFFKGALICLLSITLLLPLVIGGLGMAGDYLQPYLDAHRERVKIESIIENARLLKESGIEIK